MKINVLENKKKRAVFEVEGIDTTICNLARKELWNDKAVKVAGYHISHPLIGTPRIIIETDGKTAPVAAFKNAIKRTKTNITKLKKTIK